jgi:hypothetical protein
MALARIGLTYWWRHGRVPDLRDPRLFTELVQWRKLHQRDPRMPRLADKLMVKAEVASALGQEWVVPTLWAGEHLPEIAPCALPFVVKSRHGCNQRIFVRDDKVDWDVVRRRAATWLRRPYGYWLDEWLYRDIPRGILVEPFIGAGGALPIDYKFYVFGGEVAFVQVHLDREHRHSWVVYDRDWRPFFGHADLPRAPSALAAMIAAAETLAGDFDFVRVDFYQPEKYPIFGEMTFYPGSGLDPFDPPALDAVMGALWLEARAHPQIAGTRRVAA